MRLNFAIDVYAHLTAGAYAIIRMNCPIQRFCGGSHAVLNRRH